LICRIQREAGCAAQAIVDVVFVFCGRHIGCAKHPLKSDNAVKLGKRTIDGSVFPKLAGVLFPRSSAFSCSFRGVLFERALIKHRNEPPELSG
jgi:hypothetical protein